MPLDAERLDVPSSSLDEIAVFSSVPQSFGHGDVLEVKGLAVAVPEGVVVELKQPQGGFVFQRHGSRTLLEEVEALKVQYCQDGARRIESPPPVELLSCLIQSVVVWKLESWAYRTWQRVCAGFSTLGSR